MVILEKAPRTGQGHPEGYGPRRQVVRGWAEVHVRGISDEHGRLMVLSTHNTDIADGWEREGVDPRYFRPTEVELLIGDPTKAKQKLGWTHETSPRDLAREMVEADLRVMRDAPIGKGA